MNTGDIPGLLIETALAMAIGTPPLKIYQQGIDEEASSEKEYLAIQFVPGDTINRAVGNNDASVHQGFLQVTVVGASGKGTVRLHDLAGEVIEAWKKGTTLYGAGFKLKVPRKPSERGPIKDGKNWRVPVVIPYQVIAR